VNKSEFIKKLRSALRWTFTHNEITDILSDYEGFFASGISEGKSEAVICAELGHPVDIALELAETLGKSKKRRLSSKVIWRVIFAAALFSLCVVYSSALFGYTCYGYLRLVYDSILTVAALSILLWLTLGGTLFKTPPVSRIKNTGLKRFLPLGHVMLSGMVAGCYFRVRYLIGLLPPITEAEEAWLVSQGPAVYNMMVVFALISLLLVVLSVFAYYRITPQFFTVITHALGAVAYLSAFLHLLRNLRDPLYVDSAITAFSFIYIFSIALTLLSSLYIRFITRRAK